MPPLLKPGPPDSKQSSQNMYWILSNELVDEDLDADLCGTCSTEPADVSFDDGVALPLPISAVYTLAGRPQGRLTDHLSAGEIPGLVFSGRMCRLLQDLMIGNLQYIPLHIAGAPGGAAHDYCIVNVVGLVDCVDGDASDLEYFSDGDIEFINRLVLDEGKIPEGLDIFRLAGRPTLVLVGQALKDAIVEAGMTGFVFRRPEDGL